MSSVESLSSSAWEKIMAGAVMFLKPKDRDRYLALIQSTSAPEPEGDERAQLRNFSDEEMDDEDCEYSQLHPVHLILTRPHSMNEDIKRAPVICLLVSASWAAAIFFSVLYRPNVRCFLRAVVIINGKYIYILLTK
jgi:hypothetical protein